MTCLLNDKDRYYDKYQKYKMKYLSLKNIQIGGSIKLVVHISGPSGSGKTTLGNRLKNIFGDKIIVKDIDDLRQEFITKYYGNKKWSIIDKDAYQEYIDSYISKQKKPLIFVGLNNMPWWHKNYYYNMHSDYNYYIELDDEVIMKQKCLRLFEDLPNQKMAMYDMMNNNEKFVKRIRDMNRKWNTDYKKQGYKFMSRDNIFDEVNKIISKNQKGGIESIQIHITGPQGSGKTTLGNKLKEIYGNKIYVKDLDDLNGEFHQQDTIDNYQEFIDNFISSHDDKPLILVGFGC